MTHKHILLTAVSLSLLAACGEAADTPTTSASTTSTDTRSWCFSGGKIYTAVDAAPTTSVVAVKDGRISYVGDGSDDTWCLDNAGANARQIDLKGAAMYPGFTDAHGHLLGIGLREMTLNLEGTASVEELKTRLAAAIGDTPKGQTIYGRGWIETHWPEKRFPNRQDLDAVTTDHPVILERSDGHAIVVNSKALERSGITRDTPSPFGGKINLDDAGEPTGMLVDNAGSLVSDLMSALTPEKKREAYIRGAAIYAQRGWTNIHSMSMNPNDVPMVEELAQNGDIKIRVYNAVDVINGKVNAPGLGENKDGRQRVTTRAVKVYSDGALGSRGAALLQSYSDDPGNTGLMTMTPELAKTIYTAALKNGTQVSTHAIGDKANKTVLNWYEQAFKDVPVSERAVAEPRWRIEHSQILDKADIPRFEALGVIPSMQASHAIGDLHFAVDRLGEDRLAGGYAWQSLIDAGSIIAGGTDAPVEVGDPRIEFYAATQRKDLKGYNNPAWRPEQALAPQDALKMYTAWPAFASFQEDNLGTIEVGKWADFTIYADDIMTVDGQSILNTKTKMTIVDGRVAYED